MAQFCLTVKKTIAPSGLLIAKAVGEWDGLIPKAAGQNGGFEHTIFMASTLAEFLKLLGIINVKAQPGWYSAVDGTPVPEPEDRQCSVCHGLETLGHRRKDCPGQWQM